MSDLLVYSYLSLVTETGSLFVGSKSELMSGALRNGNIVGDTYSGAKSAKEWKQVIEKELEENN